MTERGEYSLSFQQFLSKNERKIEAIHQSASRVTGQISHPAEARFSDLGMFLVEISQVIDRLRQWRAQTKQILDGINKRYPPEKTRELLSLKEYGELCNLIGFTAQEYVQLNEKYEKLIFGLEDLQSSYSYIHSADNEIKLSPHQAEVLLDILEELDREHRLTDEGVELLAYLYDATDKHHSQKHSELSTTNSSIN